MMPQLGQKLISRFLTDFTSPANGRHMLNPQLQISQLRGVRDKVTHTFAHVHAPASNITCSIRHASPFHSHVEIKKVIFKSSGTEVITYHSAAPVCSTRINRFLLLVLLRPEVAAGSAKPVVPINVGNASTDMGNPPSPALRAAQEAGEPFQQFVPSPEDAPQQQLPPMHTSPPLWSAKPLWDSTAGLCWFYQILF